MTTERRNSFQTTPFLFVIKQREKERLRGGKVTIDDPVFRRSHQHGRWNLLGYSRGTNRLGHCV